MTNDIQLNRKNLTFPKYLRQCPHTLLGEQICKKKGFYSIFVISGTKIWIWKCGFLAFFGAKMATIDIQNLKLIVPNDYQQF